MDCRLLLITGEDYPVPECQIILKQPTIREISLIGEEAFFTGIQTLTLNKMMFDLDKSVLSEINNFQLFMTIMNQSETIDKKQAVIDVLTLMMKDKVSFTPQSMLITGASGIHTIDDSNFGALQEAISQIYCIKSEQNAQNFNPVDQKAKEIAEKIKKGRQKVAEEKGEAEASVFSQYLSILSIGLQLPITEIKNYTVFQMYDSIQRFGLWTEYDIDIRSRLAGAQPNSKPENWMKNIH